MESAGKQVDDDELKDMMKENGIGRPSTRAAIIETLFRRKYIIKNRKRLEATATGIALIRTIKNEILKSVELTGQWEKKLRLIEKGEYSVEDFKDEMIEMLQNLSYEVKTDNLSNLPEKQAIADNKKKITCPKCQEGHLLEGKNAYGCSNYNKGCNFVIPFDVMGKTLSERQVEKLCFDKKSDLLKGFDQNGSKKNGYLVLTEDFNLEFEEDKEHINKCPKCGGDKFLKGKSGFGCANYVNGCNFVVSFKDAGTDKLEDFRI
jgi:DNA topoisomerase-3